MLRLILAIPWFIIKIVLSIPLFCVMLIWKILIDHKANLFPLFSKKPGRQVREGGLEKIVKG
jgi:hypothetical protein